MNEQEWLECTDPAPMTHFIQCKLSERKYRLFECACCRHIWNLLTDGRSRKAVEVSEQYADGLATSETVAAALVEARAAIHTDKYSPAMTAAISALIPCDATTLAARAVGYHIASSTGKSKRVAAKKAAQGAERNAQCRLFRDIIGNPFHSIQINLDWLAWNDSTVRRIAQAIYDERAFDRMPILADALEDAGCDNADILKHCRSGGEHVRGCWVVDLLRGKN